MIQRVYERTIQCSLLDDVYVLTDDERIYNTVESFGGKAVMTSEQCQSGTDRAAEAIRSIDADIVANVQGDQPFVDPLMIEECVQPLIDDDTLPMCTLMHPIANQDDLHNPACVKIIVDKKGNVLYCSRSLIPYPRNNISHTVYEHIGLYVYTKDFLMQMAVLPPTILEQVESLEQLRVLEYGYRLRSIETQCKDNAFHGFSIDTEDDLHRAEEMLRQRNMD